MTPADYYTFVARLPAIPHFGSFDSVMLREFTLRLHPLCFTLAHRCCWSPSLYTTRSLCKQHHRFLLAALKYTISLTDIKIARRRDHCIFGRAAAAIPTVACHQIASVKPTIPCRVPQTTSGVARRDSAKTPKVWGMKRGALKRMVEQVTW